MSISSVGDINSLVSQFIVKPDNLFNNSKIFKRGGIDYSGFAIYNSTSSAYKDIYWGISLIKIGAISTFCLAFSAKGSSLAQIGREREDSLGVFLYIVRMRLKM